MNREDFESPDEQYDSHGSKRWNAGSGSEDLPKSRSDARYMIFWGLGGRLLTMRCCFPTLEAAISQAEKYRHCKPDCIIDRMHNDEVIHRFG